jgi:S-(hydroxymethyl)glutathione dehydrogenase/alcohol dehydrogenase
MSQKLTAAVLFKLNSNLKILKLNIPNLKPDQVLVKISYSSICRSQLMEIFSGRDNKKWLPHMLGHEGSGTVVDIGKNVKEFKKGEKVILTWISNKKKKNNIRYNYNKKFPIINAGNITTFSNLSIISKNNLVKKPKNLNFKFSALLGCCFATGPGMVFNETNPKKNSKVVLIGLGGVGLGVLLALKEKKIKSVFIIEKDPKKIEIAKKLGFKNYTKSIKKKDHSKIINFFKSKVDLCYESAGSTKTIEFGISIIKNNGRLHFASHPENSKKIKISPHEIIKGKKITGSWGGGCKPKRDFKKFAKIINKNLKLIKLIFKNEYKLTNINTAINNLKNNRDFRPMIKM